VVRTPAPIRGQVLQRVGQLLVERKDAIARAMTREMGKVVAETGGDVQEGSIPPSMRDRGPAIVWARRAVGAAQQVGDELPPAIGVAGLITPFNFPLAIPTWKMFPALLCGNSVVSSIR